MAKRWVKTGKKRFIKKRRAGPVRMKKAIARGNIRSGGVLGQELKWYDNLATGTIGQTLVKIGTGTTTLNTIPQGNSPNERIGDRAVLKGLQVRFSWTVTGAEQATENSGANKIRVMCVVDHQCNGADVTVADLLEVTTDTNSFRNLKSTSRFTVLFDKVYVVNPLLAYNGTAGSHLIGQREGRFAFYKKLNMMTQYEGTAATVASITNNSIQMYAFSDNAAPAILFDLRTRVRYIG